MGDSAKSLPPASAKRQPTTWLGSGTPRAQTQCASEITFSFGKWVLPSDRHSRSLTVATTVEPHGSKNYIEATSAQRSLREASSAGNTIARKPTQRFIPFHFLLRFNLACWHVQGAGASTGPASRVHPHAAVPQTLVLSMPSRKKSATDEHHFALGGLLGDREKPETKGRLHCSSTSIKRPRGAFNSFNNPHTCRPDSGTLRPSLQSWTLKDQKQAALVSQSNPPKNFKEISEILPFFPSVWIYHRFFICGTEFQSALVGFGSDAFESWSNGNTYFWKTISKHNVPLKNHWSPFWRPIHTYWALSPEPSTVSPGPFAALCYQLQCQMEGTTIVLGFAITSYNSKLSKKL